MMEWQKQRDYLRLINRVYMTSITDPERAALKTQADVATNDWDFTGAHQSVVEARNAYVDWNKCPWDEQDEAKKAEWNRAREVTRLGIQAAKRATKPREA